MELRERILGGEFEPVLFPVVEFLHDRLATSHQHASDAPDQRVEKVLDLERRPIARSVTPVAGNMDGGHGIDAPSGLGKTPLSLREGCVANAAASD